MQSTDKKQACGLLFTGVGALLPVSEGAEKGMEYIGMGIGISDRLWYNEPYPEKQHARYNKIKEIEAP